MIEPREIKIREESPEWSEWSTLGVTNEEKVEWQAALNEVRPSQGLPFKEDGNEVVFRDKVVEKICGILEKINRKHHRHLLDFKPVGVEEAQKNVIERLNLKDPSRRVVVIYGVGGIGKTTVATAVLSSPDLDLSGHHYFAVFMDQDSKHSDVKAVQENILHGVFNQEKPELDDCKQGRKELLEAFAKASKPVFLFIDNALKQTHLEMLLPIQSLSLLPMYSRILLTTRSLNETKMFGGQEGIQLYPYRVNSASDPEAKRILCHYALDDENGNFDRGVNMDDLLQFCGGIPLVLNIVGSHLRSDGNTVSACNEILEYHKKWQQTGFEGGEEGLSERIVDFVYKQLREHSKQAFLDIVFFFHDWSRSRVAEIVGEIELRDLEGAALVTTSGEGRYKVKTVKVHDIVSARGRQLSNEIRITDMESLSILLGDEQKLKQTKGIWLPYDDEEFSLEAQHVDLMSRSLRFLSLGSSMRVNGRCKRAFEHLRLLWIYFEDMLPIDLSKSRQLVEFRGYLMKWHGISEAKLTINLPDSNSLRRLYLSDYAPDLPVPLDIYGNPSSLRELEIFSFTLERLPESLVNLETLVMIGCEMCTLPNNFERLKCLKFLDIRNCNKLKQLPRNIECLTSLAVVRAYGCAELEAKAMDSFVQINSLLFLEMGRSPMLIERWKEIQQERPLIGAFHLFLWGSYPYGEIMSPMFFNGGSRLLHVDGKGHLAEVESCSFRDVGVKAGFLLTACDLSKEMKVKHKLHKVASEGYQIIYVDVEMEKKAEEWSWKEERKKRVKERLRQLPKGSRAWMSHLPKTALLFAYSLWRFPNESCMDTFIVDWFDPGKHAADTSIVATSVVVDEQGRSRLSHPSEMIFRSDVSESRREDLKTLLSPLHKAWEYMDQ